MILNELLGLYERLASDEHVSEALPLMGRSVQKISFVVVLARDGRLVDIQDARVENEIRGKNGKVKTVLQARNVIVPGGAHPSGSAPTPRFLWDTTDYIFGICTGTKKAEKDLIKAREVRFPAYRDYHQDIQERFNISDEGVAAVVSFLKSWSPESITDELKGKLEAFGDNFGVFRLEGHTEYVHEVQEVQDAWDALQNETQDATKGTCLITGQQNVPLARIIETNIKLPNKTSVGGGSIASFNAPAYESYGKKQTFNAPISIEAGFKSHNALNYLISNKRHQFKLGDATIVFWTGKKSIVESIFSFVMSGDDFEMSDDEHVSNGIDEAEDRAMLVNLRDFWKLVANGGDYHTAGLQDEPDTPFFVLGISPNSARIVIRYWHQSTLEEIISKLRLHYDALKIVKNRDDARDHIPLWLLLLQTVRKAEDISQLLPPALLRAVLEGTDYPEQMLPLVLRRICVTTDKYSVGRKVSYEQAALIKAILQRNHKQGGITVSLDTNNKNPAYLLGRLFAVLEKTQDEASGGVNAGVGDKYFSSASTTPAIVFPMLINLFKKHLKKLAGDKGGRAIYLEKKVEEILDSIDSVQGFPKNLSLEQRGLFAIGYYHQVRDFFTKQDNK